MDTGGRNNAMDLSKMGGEKASNVRDEWARAAATATEPVADAGHETTVSDEKRSMLPEDVALELVGATGPVTLEEIQEGVNARPGPYVAGGPIEAELDKYAAMDPPRARKLPGDGKDAPPRWEATAELRAELDTPSKIVARRTSILAAVICATADAPNAAVFAEEVVDILSGKKPMVPAGFSVELPVDVVAMDLKALAEAGILFERTAALEIHRRTDDGDDEDEREGTWLEEKSSAFSVASNRFEILTTGAKALVTPTVPGATTLYDVNRLEAETKAAADRTEFERKATERYEDERKARLQADAHLNALRRLLDNKGIGHLFHDAVAPLVPAPKPQRQVIQHIVTEKIDDHALARMFVEVAKIEDEIKEHRARIDGAKLSAGATEKDAKSRISELEERKRALQSLRHGDERTYEVDAYAVIVTTTYGPVRVVRAVADDRELLRESMTPAQAFADAASATPTPKTESETTTPDDEEGQPVAEPVAEQEAEQGKPSPEPKVSVELSAKGLRPFVVRAAILSGGEGLSREAIVQATCDVASITNPTPSVKTMVSAAVASAVNTGLIDMKSGIYSYGIRAQVLDRVSKAGEVGLRVSDLASDLKNETGEDFSVGPCASFLESAIGWLVDEEIVSRGRLPDNTGDLLWRFGETDPRQLDVHQGKSSESEEKAEPAKGRGRKRSTKAKG